jgi:formamidopyrimidine-DNA glycosylase
MIEYPEAYTLARQMNATLQGKIVKLGLRGNAPHKFAFYSGSPEDYAAILPGKKVGEADAHGSVIRVALHPGYLLGLGLGGERILYHQDAQTLPKKHQLLLQFTDDTYLTVTVQGWGAAFLLTESEVAGHPYLGKKGVLPLSDEFTHDYFFRFFEQIEPADPRSIKYFVISKPGIFGVGNGYLQDILFRAKLHPKQRAVSLTHAQKDALYDAIRETLAEAVVLDGRDTERDLHNHPGRYQRLLDSRTVGQPCPLCHAPLEKIHFLGGAAYFCPQCQPERELASIQP